MTLLRIIFLLSFTLISAASAEVLAGWEHSNPNNPAQTKRGVLLSGGGVIYGSPTIAEIDGNLGNGLETAVLTADAVLNVVSADGQLLWAAELPNHACRDAGATNKGFSTPAVAKLFNDQKSYVVVGYGGIGAKACGGGVMAFHGDTGERRWHFDLVKFAKKQNFGVPISHSVFGSPAVVDINKDGYPEIAFGSYDRNVYVLNARGKAIWYYNAADTVWSSPTFVDVNGKGRLELLIGTDITENKFLKPATKNGGYLYAFKLRIRKDNRAYRSRKARIRARRKIKKLQLFGFQNSKAYIWRTHFDQVVHSSPAVGELIAENPGQEIAIGSGCYFPETSDNKRGKAVNILSLKTGEVLRTLPTPVCVTASSAIADLDFDGSNDIVVPVIGHSRQGGNGSSAVIAFNPQTSRELWNTVPKVRNNNDIYAGHFGSATIADLDGNGSLEVITGHQSDLIVLSGRTGEQLTCASSNCATKGRLGASGIVRSTPAIGDLNGDGILEIVSGGVRSYDGQDIGSLYAWTALADTYSSEVNTAGLSFAAPWAMHRKNQLNNAAD